ncbi:hypothetical protein D3C78_1618120 [compost metagenome]
MPWMADDVMRLADQLVLLGSTGADEGRVGPQDHALMLDHAYLRAMELPRVRLPGHWLMASPAALSYRVMGAPGHLPSSGKRSGVCQDLLL